MAEEFARNDGGPMIRIGYEALGWAQRNTWAASWEVVRAANRHNVGLVLDSFNLLSVEFADPYNPKGHGRLYDTEAEALDVLRLSLAALVTTVPASRIFFVQLADAECVDPVTFLPPSPEDEGTPPLMPWSRNRRLFPMERDRGGYMPVDMVTSAILATGYTGPISHEVFSFTLNEPDESVPAAHAKRGFQSMVKLMRAVEDVPDIWGQPAQQSEAYRMWEKGQSSRS